MYTSPYIFHLNQTCWYMKITKFVENIQVLYRLQWFLLTEVSINFFKFLDPNCGVVVHLLRRDLRAFERVFCEAGREPAICQHWAHHVSRVMRPDIKNTTSRKYEVRIYQIYQRAMKLLKDFGHFLKIRNPSLIFCQNIKTGFWWNLFVNDRTVINILLPSGSGPYYCQFCRAEV